MPYKQDIWMPAIVLTSSNNKFRLLESVGVGNDERIATVAVGTYYAHNDDNLDGMGAPSLYKAIEAALVTASATNTYTIIAATPVQSSDYTNTTVAIKATAAAVDFNIDFDDADFTMEPSWFGFRLSDVATDYGSLTWNATTNDPLLSTTSGADEIITGDFTVSARWHSFSYGALNNAATDKRATRYANRKFSSKRLPDAVSIKWDSGRTRKFRYEWVPSMHLFATRADFYPTPEFQNVTDLSLYDRHQGFDQYVWESLADLQPCLIHHNVASLATALTTIELQGADGPFGSWEIVRMLNESQAQDFMSVVSLKRKGGEFYDLEIEVQIDPTYDYAGQ